MEAGVSDGFLIAKYKPTYEEGVTLGLQAWLESWGPTISVGFSFSITSF